MFFFQISALFQKNNVRNLNMMRLVFLKCFELSKNACFRMTS